MKSVEWFYFLLTKLSSSQKYDRLLTQYMNKIKQELNIRINLLQQQIPKENLENNKIDLEPLKILEKEVNRHSKEIKYLKEEKIPELLILIENSNLKNAGNGSNNFIKKEENNEINFGSRRIRNSVRNLTLFFYVISIIFVEC